MKYRPTRSAAIFFMTIFYRPGRGGGAFPPWPFPGSATELLVRVQTGLRSSDFWLLLTRQAGLLVLIVTTNHRHKHELRARDVLMKFGDGCESMCENLQHKNRPNPSIRNRSVRDYYPAHHANIPSQNTNIFTPTTNIGSACLKRTLCNHTMLFYV